ncbi:MAG: hypothetical protein A3C47_01460 [Omnitrophica bacterium RIFCSPHIGHO2_02_FULL_51_18]|nr:MAG: hypothetical protein A3C47_01460 [Omnitrophica bacterium RIFCSPHIGHO2_02_FULL_51_18]
MHALNDFFARLSRLLKKDGRYKEEAYLFVMNALNHAVERLGKPGHVTGQELLRAIQEEAQTQFGPMSATVFQHWGIKNSLDFGLLVFKMVEEGILSKTETDRLEDFRNESFFDSLFNGESHYRLLDEEWKETEKLKWQSKQ